MRGFFEIESAPVTSDAGLRDLLATEFNGESLVVLANREPFRHEHDDHGNIVTKRSTGGLVTALEPLLQACSGVWVAHGAGSADSAAVEWRDGVRVVSQGRTYRLRRVWLTDDEERGYYRGFANEGLWPLCHRAFVQPVFRSEDFYAYTRVNARFAKAACQEAASAAPVMLVQDYHFALAPRYIRRNLPESTVVTFWHIPWPHARDFEICPWAPQLLHGLLGSSILGFQTEEDCSHFMDCAESCLDAEVDRQGRVVVHQGHRTLVRAYPVSIDWPNRWAADSPPIPVCRESVRAELGLARDVLIGIGVDRLDYTKGIDHKFLAIEQLLESHPHLAGRFALVQVAEPSRSVLPAYQALRARLIETADRINRRFAAGRCPPIVLLERHFDPPDVYRLLRAADFCYVGSLHDGMNLVAKEFVAARHDECGVLVLSRFAGAARELDGALLINPYAVDETAGALAAALHMPVGEQRHRMRSMRAIVGERNAYRWIGDMLQDAGRLRAGANLGLVEETAEKVPA